MRYALRVLGRRPTLTVAIGILMVLGLAGVPSAGAQDPKSPGEEHLFNLEHVYNFNPGDHDPGIPPSADVGSDLEFFTHTVPLRDYDTGRFVDGAGNPLPDGAEPVMAARDFAVVGSHQRGGYVFDITDPESPQFVTQVTCRQPRNDVGIKKFTDPATGETRVVLSLTQQTGTPCPDESAGVGVQVNSPEGLAGFRAANQWTGTADVANQTADLVFARGGCTPADYAGVNVQGKIALVSQNGDVVASPGGQTVRECPQATFFQKMQLAERAGAIGLVQVRNDDVQAARTAVTSGIPGLELTNTDGAAILEAVRAGETVNATLLEKQTSDVPVIGEGSGGIGVFDITDPYAWSPMYRLKTGRGGVHNFIFHPTKPYGYASNGALPGLINQLPIVDFTDLDNPTVLDGPDTEGGVHDVEFSPDGNRAYAASENNYRIYDTTDPANPVLLSRTPNVGSYAHGVFPSPDLSLMVTNNESLALGGFFAAGTGVCPGEGLASYDITNEGLPVGPLGYYVPEVVGRTPDHRACTSHFGRFAPGTTLLSMGWYIAGTRIVDWSNPSAPVEVAGAVLPGTETWAAKFHTGPYVYAADLGRGFDVFRWSGEGRAPWVVEADLGIDQTDSPDPVRPGNDLTYTIEVTNAGPDDATGVTVTDRLPNRVTFREASASQGACSESDGVVTCEIGALENGSSATATIEVTAPAKSRPITNAASVSADTDDPDPGNNSASETTRVSGPPVGKGGRG